MSLKFEKEETTMFDNILDVNPDNLETLKRIELENLLEAYKNGDESNE